MYKWKIKTFNVGIITYGENIGKYKGKVIFDKMEEGESQFSDESFTLNISQEESDKILEIIKGGLKKTVSEFTKNLFFN